MANYENALVSRSISSPKVKHRKTLIKWMVTHLAWTIQFTIQCRLDLRLPVEGSYLDTMPIPKPDVRCGIGAYQMDVSLVSFARTVQYLVKPLAFVTGGLRSTAKIHRDFTATTTSFTET
ncbi:PREDICTED: uncharacterized protein LOC105458410 isoform X2 [Wasmannia auropunctata]|uniref:uncharacterized protein LOC105458410 isoform X2 n=1 Tax=Wasmannia auropunctata TaxID=64793 RepID=UPI0005F0ACDE|nr:PREDICTED: uncharacterized protein LOC105458410 isoform X2 [Wasmannia auropunctata]XP_011701999.1 PREDICTED: uncharacterized protein LOC105458410 isoform X2 [Wasmannia auropunctata]